MLVSFFFFKFFWALSSCGASHVICTNFKLTRIFFCPKKETAPAAAEDEIDYDDDDIPPPAVNASKAQDVTASASAEPAAESAPAAANAEEKADDASTPTAAATTEKTEEASAEPAAPLFTQGLAPTNAKTEAEKRAARAARFGITVDKDSDEAKQAERAARFGVANEHVSALDSALPERQPKKRGHPDGARAQQQQPAQKRKVEGGGQQHRNGSGAGAGGRRGQQQGGGRRGNNNRGQGQGQGQRNGGGSAGGVQKKSAVEDPAEKAKREARAKRFA